MSPLQIDRVAAGEGPLLLRVTGELDFESAAAFRAAVERTLDHGRPVVVDLRGLEMLDSSGLGALLEAKRRSRLAGGDLRVTGQHGAVARLLKRTGTLGPLTTA